jgi:hypothetical protein
LAVAHVVAAFVVWRTRFGVRLPTSEIDELIALLRDERGAATASKETGNHVQARTIQAVALPGIICAPMLQIPRRMFPAHPVAVTFRDEVLPSKWRELATLLRHQARTPPSNAQDQKNQ